CLFTIATLCVPRPTPYAKWRSSMAPPGTVWPESSRRMRRERIARNKPLRWRVVALNESRMHRAAPATSNLPYFDLHLDCRAEPVHDRHKAVNSKSAEVCIADAREIGCCNSCSIMRAAHAQFFPVEHFDDFGGQDRL